MKMPVSFEQFQKNPVAANDAAGRSNVLLLHSVLGRIALHQPLGFSYICITE